MCWLTEGMLDTADRLFNSELTSATTNDTSINDQQPDQADENTLNLWTLKGYNDN